MNPPTAADIRRWKKYLAAERAEAAVYRDLASRRTGEEREILLALAEAESRHEAHWLALLGEHAGEAAGQALAIHDGERDLIGRSVASVPLLRSVPVRTRILGWFARRFGSVFVLALAQRAEARSPYEEDADATPAMAADERIHEEVVRGLAARGRNRLSGTFRAAVFGANDGLVSNLALVLGIGATGVSTPIILATGLAGLLAGALSMGAGEFVSVRSQRELLAASNPNPAARRALPHLDVDANELSLVYRARGMSQAEAIAHAAEVLGDPSVDHGATETVDAHEEIGSAWGAATSSFWFFSSGAIIPVLPYIFGLEGFTAVIVSAILVGVALLATGAIVGLLSGAAPHKRALRQLAIGFGAAAATYGLGLAFGAVIA